MAKKKNLEALEALENVAKGQNGQINDQVEDDQDDQDYNNNEDDQDDQDDQEYLSRPNNQTSLLDGYKIIENYDLPQNGELYPESWRFAYRCPEAKEVANFSTVNDQDQPAIISAIEDLVKKCVVIYDVKKDKQINSSQINDAHRIFFVLKLREEYLSQNPLEYNSICMLCKEKYQANLKSSNLIYAELSQKLIDAFDGRMFTLQMPGIEEPIKFLIPTIDITSKIFKYVVKVYRNGQNDRDKKEDLIVYDKKFLLLAPFLYEKGTESIKEISNKFQKIQKNEKLFKAYLEIVNKLKLDHFEYIECECPNCKSLEEAPIRFPGGWKNMFVSNKDLTGYFD